MPLRPWPPVSATAPAHRNREESSSFHDSDTSLSMNDSCVSIGALHVEEAGMNRVISPQRAPISPKFFSANADGHNRAKESLKRRIKAIRRKAEQSGEAATDDSASFLQLINDKAEVVYNPNEDDIAASVYGVTKNEQEREFSNGSPDDEIKGISPGTSGYNFDELLKEESVYRPH